jgi:hypothetical protein
MFEFIPRCPAVPIKERGNMKQIAMLFFLAALCSAQALLTNQPPCPTQPSATIQCGGWPVPAAPTGLAGLVAKVLRRTQTTSGALTLGAPAIEQTSTHSGNPVIPPMTVGTVYLRWPVSNNQMIMTVPPAQWTQSIDAQGNSVLTVTGVPAHTGFVIEAVSK